VRNSCEDPAVAHRCLSGTETALSDSRDENGREGGQACRIGVVHIDRTSHHRGLGTVGRRVVQRGASGCAGGRGVVGTGCGAARDGRAVRARGGRAVRAGCGAARGGRAVRAGCGAAGVIGLSGWGWGVVRRGVARRCWRVGAGCGVARGGRGGAGRWGLGVVGRGVVGVRWRVRPVGIPEPGRGFQGRFGT
jgi:hypothetical protein